VARHGPNVDLISYGYQWDGVGFLFYNNPATLRPIGLPRKTRMAPTGHCQLDSNVYKNYMSDCWLMGNYGTTSVLVDQMARGGNSTVGMATSTSRLVQRQRAQQSRLVQQYLQFNLTPAAAKNPIHVGASNTNNNTIASFSSGAPPTMGVSSQYCRRRLPDDRRSGHHIYRQQSGQRLYEHVRLLDGDAAVAGSIALMLQHYRDVYNTSGNFWPSTAKAILMHTADDLGNPGPDYQWGYGR